MGTLALLSAKGAPGTTTTAMLLAALWPRPCLLVDADTDGGDIGLRLRRQDGELVDRDQGLLSLLALARRELSPQALVEHAQVLAGGTELIAGFTGSEQAAAARQLWTNLAAAFAQSDRDVIIDCGRVTPTSAHLPLLQHADVVACVLRPDVTGVIHTRARLLALRPMLVGPDGHKPRLGNVLIGPRVEDRDVVGAQALLTRDLPDSTAFGVLVHDPEGASIFSGRELTRPERTLLVRSGHVVVDALAGSLAGPGSPAVPDAEPAVAGPDDVRHGRRAAPGRTRFRRRQGA